MIRNITVLFLFVLSFSLLAQTNEDKKYNLTTTTSIQEVNLIRLLDPYLSPLDYNGVGYGYKHLSRKLFQPDNTKLSMQDKYSALIGVAFNPAFSAQMTYFGFGYSWGMHYRFEPIKDLQVLVGGSTSADFAFKSLSRNVNNPVNFDITANINLSTEAIYDIHLSRRTLKLKYSFEAPIFGCMFVPMGGASYYEMFDLGNFDNAIHLSSLHNKQGYDNSLSIDVPFKHSTWQFGISKNILKYKANDLVFSKSITSIQIACVYDLYIFRGTKDQAPKNFIHSIL